MSAKTAFGSFPFLYLSTKRSGTFTYFLKLLSSSDSTILPPECFFILSKHILTSLGALSNPLSQKTQILLGYLFNNL